MSQSSFYDKATMNETPSLGRSYLMICKLMKNCLNRIWYYQNSLLIMDIYLFSEYLADIASNCQQRKWCLLVATHRHCNSSTQWRRTSDPRLTDFCVVRYDVIIRWMDIFIKRRLLLIFGPGKCCAFQAIIVKFDFENLKCCYIALCFNKFQSGKHCFNGN